MAPSGVLFSAAVLMALVAVAHYPTRPPKALSTRRDLARLARHLRRHPDAVTWADVRRLLGEAVPEATAAHVTAIACERAIPRSLLWQWGDRHGPGLLALALAAGLEHPDLLASLTDASTLDVRSLELLSELYRFPLSLARPDDTAR